MKKSIALLLALACALPLFAACSAPALAPLTVAETETAKPVSEEETEEFVIPVRTVKDPMTERPNYVLHEGATADEMRAMAVKAMRDMLTIVWYPDKDVEYIFTSVIPENSKSFHLRPLTTYAGLPYTNAITSLFHFLEYYDPATGRVTAPTAEVFNSTLGNQCAGGVLWGWASCVPSFDPKNTGFGRRAENIVGVGPYRLPEVSEEKSSAKICEANGDQLLFESYALLNPADILVSTGNPGDAGHLMMVVETPNVVRNADGTIDGEKSTVVIQDQRGGARSDSSEYLISENGEKHHYSGRTGAELTFAYLFKTFYLPITCREFLGERPYVMPSVTPDREISSLEDLKAATLSSQYLICLFRVSLTNGAGETAYSRTILTAYSDMNAGKLKNYPLGDLRITPTILRRNVSESGDFTFTLTCLDATGSEFEVATFPVTVS